MRAGRQRIRHECFGLNLNCSGCIIDIQSGGSLTLAGSGTIGNGATLQVSGTGTLTIASGGTLAFQSGSQFTFPSGTVDIQNGGTINFQPGSNGATTGGVMGGAGTLSISGGTLNIGSVTSPGTFVMTAGTLTGPGFLSIVNTMTWSGGTLTGSGGTELAGTGIGTIDGANGAISPMVLDGTAGRSFNNYGTIHYTTSAAHPLQLTSAVFTTYGIFYFENDNSITGASPSSFNVSPNGVVGKTGGTLSTINPPFTNNGANAFSSSGTLEFAGNITTTSNFSIFFANIGATLKFSAPTSTFDASSLITTDSTSTIVFSAGSAQISGEYSVDGSTDICGATVDITSGQTNNFKFTSGQLTVESDFTVTGSGTWSGGTMFSTNANAFFDVASGATMTIDAATGFPTDNFLLFANDGNVNYTATAASGNYLKFMNGALVDNTGLFDIQTDVQIFSGSSVVVGTAKNTVSELTARTRAARMARLTAAAAKRGRAHALATCVCSSSNEFDNSGTLQKSSGTGTTDFGPILDNSGAVNAMIGTISFLDTYTQTAGSRRLAPAISSSSPRWH